MLFNILSQHEMHTRSFALFTGRPYVASVIFHNLFNYRKTYAAASVQFSFDGAAEGTAPNGYAFGISAVASDKVLEKALACAGIVFD